MPQAAVVAGLQYGLPALGLVGGAVIQSRAQNKATKATQDSTNKALAFEQERETYNRQQRERAQAEYRQLWDAWQRQRQGWLQRYGVAPRSTPGRPADARASRLTLGTLSRKAPPPVELQPIPNAPMRQPFGVQDLQPIPTAPPGQSIEELMQYMAQRGRR